MPDKYLTKSGEIYCGVQFRGVSLWSLGLLLGGIGSGGGCSCYGGPEGKRETKHPLQCQVIMPYLLLLSPMSQYLY